MWPLCGGNLEGLLGHQARGGERGSLHGVLSFLQPTDHEAESQEKEEWLIHFMWPFLLLLAPAPAGRSSEP